MPQLPDGSPDRDGLPGADLARDVVHRGVFDHSLAEAHVWQVVRDEAGAVRTWRLVDANPAALRSWRRELGEVVDRTVDEIFPGARATELFLPIVREIMETQSPREWEIPFTGTGQILHMVTFPVGDFFVSTGLDVTERRRMEERVQAAQRVEAVATLAAGIAHDFNNLLMAISGNLELAKELPAGDPEAAVCLREVEDAVRHAEALTSQFLTFSKGGAPLAVVTSIGDLVVESASFVTRGSRCRCAFSVADDLPTVEVDPDQISQVIANLVINAAQSMPEGGVIDVGAEAVTLAEASVPELEPGDYVRLRVADSGTGIEAERLPHIFEPFYTTKTGGSGLGLASAATIVANHGGRITVASTAGEGSTFDIYLPASNAPATPVAHPTVVRGSGRILVMDDTDAIRALFQRLLASLGYTSDTASDGDEAVRRVREAMEAGTPYDAVILDLTVAGKPGGVQVLQRLREVDRRVPALVASGYAEDQVLAEPGRFGFDGRLRKPVGRAVLSQELARVLAGREGGGG